MQKSPPIFSPSLPESLTNSLANIGMGLLEKVILYYDEPWWGTIPSWNFILPSDIATEDQNFSLPQEGKPKTKEDAEWLIKHQGIGVQNYIPINGNNILVCFAGPPVANSLELVDDKWIIDTLHSRISRSILPSHLREKVSEPKFSVITRWNSDIFSRGSYSYFAATQERERSSGNGPADMRVAGTAIWHGKLGFCGEHTEPNW